MKLTETIDKRRSIRKFKNKTVKWADVLEAIDIATKTPLAGNTNTLKFIIIKDPELKQHIAMCADQPWISQADTVLIVCSEDAQLHRLYEDRAEMYNKQQIGAAIQNLLLKLTELGLGSCWVGAFLDHEIKNVLEIPKEAKIEAIIPVGYADEKPKVPKKAALQNIIFWEKWNVRKKPTHVKDSSTW